MPASSPVLAWRLLLSVLISVDLPTLGTPQISTRMGLAMPPRLGDSRWHASISLRVGAGSDASSGKARVSLWALYQSTHCAVRSGSATSCLLSTLSVGLWPVISASSGLALEPGKRASSTSITTSMSLMRSVMALRVRCM
ncbi:hypothetical protein D3C87_1806450 [compost metagenome]